MHSFLRLSLISLLLLPSVTCTNGEDERMEAAIMTSEERGELLFTSKTCIACHNFSGGLVGPPLNNIGDEITLDDNTTKIFVDEAYVRESIADPMLKSQATYPKAMPLVPLADQELTDLVNYIKSQNEAERIEPAVEPTVDALWRAIWDCNADEIIALVEAGADVNGIDRDLDRPMLTWAAMKCPPEIIAVLLKAGANVNGTYGDGYTALHQAARSNSAEVVRALLEAGANVNAMTPFGNPLQYAARICADSEVITVLLKAGADPRARHKRYFVDALDVAKKMRPFTGQKLMTIL